jgi:hypothetical protein
MNFLIVPIIVLISNASTLTLQYLATVWAIKTDNFYNYAHTYGGFIVFLIIYTSQVKNLINYYRVGMGNEKVMITRFGLLLFLIASFWLNYLMMI